jgi:hypothetical protein
MSFLEELNMVIDGCGLPVETGVFSGKAPDTYAVITPLTDTFAVHADNIPHIEICEARISLYTKGSYTSMAKEITHILLAAWFTITERKYIGFEDSTKYHHWSLDAAKEYYFRRD